MIALKKGSLMASRRNNTTSSALSPNIAAIASKLGIHRKTVVYWRDIGIKINGIPIRLKMVKKPFQWYSKGKWIIEFFLKTNVDVDMD
jgi:type IV pilus biogenesis protein CpaD/CtpE